MLCYNALQLVFCAEIISSPLLAQDSIRAGYHKSRVFVLGKVFTAHAFFCWYSFFSTVTLCKVVPGLICNMVAWSSRAVSFCLFCTRLLFSSFGRHWYKVALKQVQPAQVLPNPHRDAPKIHWKAPDCHVRSIQDGVIMSYGTENARPARVTSMSLSA